MPAEKCVDKNCYAAAACAFCIKLMRVELPNF